MYAVLSPRTAAWRRRMSPSRSIRALLQLDENLAIAPLADVDGRLDAAARHVAHRAGLARHFDVLSVLAARVQFRGGGDPVAFELHDQIVQVVPVNIRFRAGHERQLPHSDAIVFEQQGRADVAEDALGVFHYHAPMTELLDGAAAACRDCKCPLRFCVARANRRLITRPASGAPRRASRRGSSASVPRTRRPSPPSANSNDSTCAFAKGTEERVTVHAQRVPSSQAIISSTQYVLPTCAWRIVPTPYGGALAYDASLTFGNHTFHDRGSANAANTSGRGTAISASVTCTTGA